MVDFRKKLLGLGLLVSAFTGVSYGQLLCPLSNAANAYQIQPGLAANLLRVEGMTEEVADLNIYCGAGSTLATGTLTVTLNAQVTSKGVGGATDALLSIATNNNIFGGPAAPPTITATPTLYYGNITAGSQTVVFSNVSFPAGAFTMTIQNIRVNASQISITPGANQVNESVLVTNAGVGIFAPASQLVGLVYQGFAKATASNVNNWLICLSSPQPVAAPSVPIITIAELFGGAFKSTWPQGQTAASTVKCGVGALACTSTNGENGTGNQGYFTALGTATETAPATVAAGTGLATHGTRFQIAFANIPAGVTLTVPVTPTGTAITNGAANFTMQLVSSATGAYSALASGVLTTSAAGTATAYYEVIATDNTVQLESINISVSPSAKANFSISPAGPITAVVTVAPQVALSTTSDVPDFTTPTPAPLNLTTWSLCQTTLLFPFVSTNGVETGIALSNTSADPGNIGATGGTATNNQGSCALNFYGTLASAASTPVTYLGVQAPNAVLGGATPYIQPAGTSNAFPIGQDGLVPAGFSGYMIAQCNYLYGHGFAYIAYQLGTASGATMGYTANVFTTGRSTAGAVPANVEGLTN